MIDQTKQLSWGPFPRNTLLAGCLLLAFHAATLLKWGTHPPGPLLSDLLQLAMGALCGFATHQASRRSEGIARYFWRLATIMFLMFVVAQTLASYDDAFHAPHAVEWFTNLLFFFLVTPLGMALFLDPATQPKGFDPLLILDLLQVVLFWLAGYIYFFYLRSQSQSGTDPVRIVWGPYFAYTSFLTVVFFLRFVASKAPVIRSLFGRLAIFLFLSLWADYFYYHGPGKDLPTGAWYDFVWISTNFLFLALVATWNPPAQPRSVGPALPQPHSSLMIQILPLLFSLLIVVVSARIAADHPVFAASVVLVSFASSSARLLITQFRQQRGHRLLEAVIEGATDAVYVKDREGHYLMMNEASAALAGHEIANVVGKTDRELFSPGISEHIAAWDRSVFQSGQTVTYEEAVSVAGQPRTYLSIKGAYRDAQGKIAGLFGISRDITDRKTMEENLRVQKAFLEQLIETAPEAIAIVDPDYTVRKINHEFTRVFGYTSEEACGKDLGALVVPPDKEEESLRLDNFSDRSISSVLETTRRRKDGTRVDVSVLVSPVMFGSGMDAIYCIYRDISDRKTVEGQLRQSQKMEAIGRLAGGVAHDLNNLLTVITGYSELQLSAISPSDPKHAQAEQIRQAAERASTLTRQLLAFSRRQVLQPRAINLNSVVDSVESLLRRLIGEDVDIVFDPAPDLGTVRADPGQMEQVIMNLAINARDAMPRGGKLVLQTSNAELDDSYSRIHIGVKPGNYVLLSVSDTGAGMDETTLSHIFEPFFTTKETGKGTGLGLSTVYGIVQQSNGHIWVYSEPGHGTSFKIYLPRVDESATPFDGDRLSQQEARGHETILVVEDDPQVRELTCALLERCGYSVLSTDQMSEVEKLCREHRGTIHLLLTDMIMPGMTGKEVARVVKQLRPGIRVLYMSGYTDDVIDLHGGLGPETHFLQKPFTSVSLAEKVRQSLA
jgi:two-component system cell cycle sensor histidine kinase/response regulator CckA